MSYSNLFMDCMAFLLLASLVVPVTFGITRFYRSELEKYQKECDEDSASSKVQLAQPLPPGPLTLPKQGTTLNGVKRVESADGVRDGVYIGTWTGRSVEFETPHGILQANANYAVNIPCTVEVKCGTFNVQSIPSGIEKLVCDDISYRQELGISKYGKTVAASPLDLRAWLQHAYEECLDQSIYLRRAIAELDNAAVKSNAREYQDRKAPATADDESA